MEAGFKVIAFSRRALLQHPAFLEHAAVPAWRYAERLGELAITSRCLGWRRSGQVPTIQSSAWNRRISAGWGQARSSAYNYLVPFDDLTYELVYSDYPAISSVARVIGPDPASYMMARNTFDALAIAESIGLAAFETTVKRCEVPSALILPCLVRPVLSCAILDDEWQRFNGPEREYHGRTGGQAS